MSVAASSVMMANTYDAQKEAGGGHYEKKMQYRGPTPRGSRSHRNGWKASDLRRRLDRHSQGSRRTDIRNIITNYGDNLEELSQEDLPVSVRTSLGATGGYSRQTSTGWHHYQSQSLVTNGKIEEESTDFESPNLNRMSDEEILRLALNMSQIEY